MDFWNEDYEIFKEKHVKPFAECFAEYCTLNGDKEDFQSDIFDALGVFATDVTGLDGVIAATHPPKRYKQRMAAIRKFMQQWIEQYRADSQVTAELMQQYKPPPVRWIAPSNASDKNKNSRYMEYVLS